MIDLTEADKLLIQKLLRDRIKWCETTAEYVFANWSVKSERDAKIEEMELLAANARAVLAKIN